MPIFSKLALWVTSAVLYTLMTITIGQGCYSARFFLIIQSTSTHTGRMMAVHAISL